MATTTAQKEQCQSSSVEGNFTSEMRDRQARGKNPYSYIEGSEEENGDKADKISVGSMSETECFRDREKKGEALAILTSTEMLLAQAIATGDSLAGAKLRFEYQLSGYSEKKRQEEYQARLEANQRPERVWMTQDLSHFEINR